MAVPAHVTSARPVAAPTGERLGFVDAAKGLGILLVVLGHALGGMVSASLVRDDDAYGTTYNVIYQFHMAFFFFLSGLFVQRRVQASPGRFVRGSLRSLVPPYLIWLPVQLFLLDLASSQTNTSYHFTAYDYLAVLWSPGSQFWYLYALLIMHLVSALLLPRYGLLALFASALIGYGLVPHGLWGPFPFAARFALFYVLGVGFFSLTRELESSRAKLWGGMLVTGAGFVAAVLAANAHGYTYWTLGSLPAAILGAACTLQLCALLATTAVAGVLAYLGQQTMPIFLLHVMFCSGTRIALHKLLGWNSPAAILPVVFVVGLLAPLLCNWVAEKLGVASVLGFRVSKRSDKPARAQPASLNVELS
jgi:fucose 4-O-acetylase-like acetyltransferase